MAQVEYGGAEVRATFSGRDSRQRVRGSTDIELRGVCERDDFEAMPWRANKVSPSLPPAQPRRQTYPDSTCEAAPALRVSGKEWVAVTKVDEIATAGVETGRRDGALGRPTREMTSAAPAAFPG